MRTDKEIPSIAIFGLGYVGCVTAACFAELGYRVTGVDVDVRKVRAVEDGRSPFYEPGLEALIQSNLRNQRLSATVSTAEALRDADFAFLCVGTPSASNGNLNLDPLRRVTADISGQLSGRTRPLTVMVRSTVFPGTCDEVVAPLIHQRRLHEVLDGAAFAQEFRIGHHCDGSMQTIPARSRIRRTRIPSPSKNRSRPGASSRLS